MTNRAFRRVNAERALFPVPGPFLPSPAGSGTARLGTRIGPSLSVGKPAEPPDYYERGVSVDRLARHEQSSRHEAQQTARRMILVIERPRLQRRVRLVDELDGYRRP